MRLFLLSLLTLSLSSCALTGTGGSDATFNVDVENSATKKIDPEIQRSSESMHHYLLGELQMKDQDLPGALANLSKASELSSTSAPSLHAKLAELELRSGSLDAALAESTKALEQDPNNIAILLLHAGILESLDRLNDAESIYKRVIVAEPKRVEAYVLLSSLYSKQGDTGKAIQTLKTIVSLAPEEPVAHYYLGRTYEQADDLKEAEKQMSAALAIQPENIPISVELLRVLLKSQKIAEAKDLCNKILERDSENVVARRVLGHMLIGENKLDEALQHLQVLENVEDDATDTRFKIALIDIERRNFDEAIRELNLVLARKPDHAQARYYLGSVLAGLGKTKEGTAELLKIDSQSSELFVKSRTFAAFLMKQDGDTTGAERAIREALDTEKDNKHLLNYLISILRDEQKFSEAEGLLRKAIADDPENDKLLFTLGIVQHDLGQKEESFKTMERALEVNPNNTDALNFVAYGLVEHGKDLKKALSLIEKALSARPNDGYYLDTMGWIYYEMGSYSEAVESLARAVSVVSDDIVILEHYGNALEKNGETDKALEVYKMAVEKDMNHNDSDAVEALDRIRKRLDALTP